MAILIVGMYACGTAKNVVSNSNSGNIKVEVSAIAGKDSIVRTSNGTVIGKMDKDGNLYDLAGKRIGKRKPTDAELIIQAGF